jgi:hypothetical protein
MKFAPIEGEFWIVEMQPTPHDPDYHGPFSSQDEAMEWGRSKGSVWKDFIVIHVLPPRLWDDETNDDDAPPREPSTEKELNDDT